MSIATRLMASGLSPMAATNITGDFAGGLTATGSTQATALLLTAACNAVTTTAASTGVQTMALSPGDWIYIHNSGASTLSVYGQTGVAIQGGAVNAAFSVATNKGVLLFCVSSTLLSAVLSA